MAVSILMYLHLLFIHSVPGHSKPSDGDGRSVLERRGEGAEREEVLTVPESPTEIASYGFDDESVAAVLEEEERETQKEKVELIYVLITGDVPASRALSNSCICTPDSCL